MYEIKDWKKTFENARSRQLKRLDWIQFPAGVDSNGSIELASLEDEGLIAESVFNRLCQWTATHPPQLRGKLCRSDGRELSVNQIATHIRVKAETVRKSIELLTSPEVGWIIKREKEDPMFRSTHEEDLDEQPTPENPALDYGTPERLPVDTSGPIPFGIEADAIEELDWLRIEAAFVAAWNTKQGLGLLVTPQVMTAANQRVFQTRCRTPGWLALAEKAINKFPTPWHTANAPQKLTLKKFMEDEEAAAAIAEGGRYSGTGKDVSAKSVDKTANTTAASQKAHESRTASDRAKTEREKLYRTKLADKWGADSGLLTDKDIADLDQKYPSYGLYGLKITGTKKNAAASMNRLYVAKLHEVMEVDSGGKSFAETEGERL